MARPQKEKPDQPQLGLGVPHYVLVQLRALAARRRCSLRFLVLEALASIGVHVEPADLIEDRRLKRAMGSRRHYAGTPRIKSDVRRALPD